MVLVLIWCFALGESSPQRKRRSHTTDPKTTCKDLTTTAMPNSSWRMSSFGSVKFKRYIDFRSNRDKYPYDNYEDFYIEDHGDFGWYADNYRDHWDSGFWVLDSGFVHLSDYGDKGHCYHSFAKECQFGVEISIQQMNVEGPQPDPDYDVYYDDEGTTEVWECPYDYFEFVYTDSGGDIVYPDYVDLFCGCLEDANGKCDKELTRPPQNEDIEFKNWYQPAYKTHTYKTTTGQVNHSFPDEAGGHAVKGSSFKLLGTNLKFVFKSDGGQAGGEVGFFWNCLSSEESYATFGIYLTTPFEWRKRRQADELTILDLIKDVLTSQFHELNPYASTASSTAIDIDVSESDPTETTVKVTFSGMPKDSNMIDADNLVRGIKTLAKAALGTPQFMFLVDQVELLNIKPIVKLQPRVTNTKQMAQAVLKQEFKPAMAYDYGCAGRGYFDPFSKTIGKTADPTDVAFFKWKKCIQCATGNDPRNIKPYDYDDLNDTCGKSLT